MDTLVEELKQRIIDSLNLEEVEPKDIDPVAPLFGKGLGLDSIDALELAAMLERHYGIRITDLRIGREAFASVNAMASFVVVHRKK